MSVHDLTFQRVAAQAARVEKARVALARAQNHLDSLVAESVSADPASPVWYDRPGVLTRDQVRGAAGLTELGLQRTIARYQRFHASRPRPKR